MVTSLYDEHVVHGGRIKYLSFQSQDSDEYPITQHFPAGIEFIQEAISSGGVVLVSSYICIIKRFRQLHHRFIVPREYRDQQLWWRHFSSDLAFRQTNHPSLDFSCQAHSWLECIACAFAREHLPTMRLSQYGISARSHRVVVSSRMER